MTPRTVIEAKLAAIDQRKAETLQALQRRREKLKAQLAALDRPTKSQRRLDTRRKMLLGAFILGQLEHAGLTPQTFSLQGQRFLEWLVRPNDRALFGEGAPVSIQVSPPSAAPSPATVADAPHHSLRCDEPPQHVFAGKSKRRATNRVRANGKKKPRRKQKPQIALSVIGHKENHDDK